MAWWLGRRAIRPRVLGSKPLYVIFRYINTKCCDKVPSSFRTLSLISRVFPNTTLFHVLRKCLKFHTSPIYKTDAGARQFKDNPNSGGRRGLG